MKRILVLTIALLLICSMTGCSMIKNLAPKLDGNQEASQPENTQNTASGHEVSVLDNENYAMKITDVGTNEYDDCAIMVTLQIENRSEDTSYTFEAEWALINGIKETPAMLETVTPGKKAIVSIEFGWNLPSSVMLDAVTYLEILFQVSEADAYDPIEEVVAHIYPCGKNNVKDYSYVAKPTDTVLVDTPELKIVVTDYLRGDYDNYYIMLYVENRLDVEIRLNGDDVSVDGYMVDGWLWDRIQPGTTYYYAYELYASEQTSNIFEDIEKLEFGLVAEYRTEDWKTTTIVDDTFTLTP